MHVHICAQHVYLSVCMHTGVRVEVHAVIRMLINDHTYKDYNKLYFIIICRDIMAYMYII